MTDGNIGLLPTYVGDNVSHVSIAFEEKEFLGI